VETLEITIVSIVLRLYGRERHKRQDLERLGRALYAIRDQECFDG